MFVCLCAKRGPVKILYISAGRAENKLHVSFERWRVWWCSEETFFLMVYMLVAALFLYCEEGSMVTDYLICSLDSLNSLWVTHNSQVSSFRRLVCLKMWFSDPQTASWLLISPIHIFSSLDVLSSLPLPLPPKKTLTSMLTEGTK